MSIALDKAALDEACRKLASQVLWTGKGESMDVVETLAARFRERCIYHEEFIVGQDRDPNILVRAVRYLTQVHAIPPMGTDALWFERMMQCLVELAVPNTGLSPEGAEVLRDIQVGVQLSLDDSTID
ncbi:hypothetical protein [Paraburkholderia sp. BR14312]